MAVSGALHIIVDQEVTVKQQNKARCTIEDFTCISVLGRGIIQRREMFAIKAINKRDTVDCEIVERLMCEQRIMEMATNAPHPFFINMFSSFQTELHACFVMEYAAWGDLLTHSKGESFAEPRPLVTIEHNKRLLCRGPQLRLGAGERDAQEVREQLFFREIDWSALLARKIQPPFVPTIQGHGDVEYGCSKTCGSAQNKRTAQEEEKEERLRHAAKQRNAARRRALEILQGKAKKMKKC
ncbi:hypothetical protein AAFF_G00407130 [Aldrovandia affinis]|uniref:AGC-kinase C-terminal domain-containing protein n=1 Tax=Aldrovandia affinis TaxID=143900 RepID=A0AAD7SCS5_9TELE|nr:hypothetical protein AAFF_G00407130 [Aldrovandia affinis]